MLVCTSKLGAAVLHCIHLSVRACSISLGMCAIIIQQENKKRMSIPATKSFIVSAFNVYMCCCSCAWRWNLGFTKRQETIICRNPRGAVILLTRKMTRFTQVIKLLSGITSDNLRLLWFCQVIPAEWCSQPLLCRCYKMLSHQAASFHSSSSHNSS